MVDKEVKSSLEETPEYDDPFEDDDMGGEPYPEVTIEKVRWIVENDVDEQSDNDPVNEQFFDVYLEINLAM